MARNTVPSNISRLVTLATIALVVTILYVAHTILVPLALAILFTFVLSPVVARLERWKVHRAPAVIGVVLICFMILLLIGWIVSGQLGNLADNLDQYRGNIAQKLINLSPHSQTWMKFTRVASEVEEKFDKPTTQATTQSATQPTTMPISSDGKIAVSDDNPVPVAIVRSRSAPLDIMQEYLGYALGPLATAGLVIIFVIFILLRREDLRDRLIKLVAHGSLTITTQAIDDAAARISRYLTMQSLVNIGFGLIMGLSFWIIGIPNSFLWGLLCCIFRFIPYIGTWIAAIFPLGLSLAVFKTNGQFIATAIIYLAVELIIANFVEPYLYGSSTGLSEVAVLLAAVFWAWLWGPIGLLLSTPLTTILVVIGKHFPNLEFFDTLLSDTPVLDPHMRYYQRLLAMDENESLKLLEEYLEKMPLENVYDHVVIPALVLTEKDRRQGQLSEERQKFILTAVTNHIQRLGERREELKKKAEESENQKPSELKKVIDNIPLINSEKIATPETQFYPVPTTGRPEIQVLCLPAHSDADSLTAAMLAQCLSIRGFTSNSLDVTLLAGEMMQKVQEKKPQIVAISALPPRAMRFSRYLCKRLRAWNEQLPIAVGLWNSRIDLRLAKRRLGLEGNIHAAKSLCSLIEVIDQLAKHFPHI
ncbi:MAG TPA: AI-2E family transporter [Tepidisphaeraceae bacterium]|jgi:predicted PurR-regulated permease PerM